MRILASAAHEDKKAETLRWRVALLCDEWGLSKWGIQMNRSSVSHVTLQLRL